MNEFRGEKEVGQGEPSHGRIIRPAVSSAPVAVPNGATSTDRAPALAACTIVSKNYLSLARVWNESFLRHHPGARTFVLIVDRIEGKFDRSKEAFEVIEVEELEIPGFADMAFKYNILELNTAVKPFLMEYLFKNRGVEELVYLDPDTFVYAPLTRVAGALTESKIVLIPHILAPLEDDGKRPNETDFLISGTYNLGFIALRRHPTSLEFLSWWKQRLSNGCFSAPERGLFTDQKWVDLVPTIFPDVSILKDRGYNVAYWNLHERKDLAEIDGQYRYSEAPLAFFHFSGLEFDRPERVSKYQSRHRLAQLPSVFRRIFLDYISEVRKAGLEDTRSWPYTFGAFDDGVPIVAPFRGLYSDQGELRKQWSNPFDTAPGGFRDWMLGPVTPGSLIPRFLFDLYRRRKDLQDAFPNSLDGDPAPLLEWAVARLGIEHGVHEFFLGQLRRTLCEIEATAAPPVPSAPPVLVAAPVSSASESPRPLRLDLVTRTAYTGNPRSALMRLAQGLVGRKRYRRYRYRIWQFRLWREAAQTLEDDGSAMTLPKRLGESLLGSVNYRALRRVLWQSRESELPRSREMANHGIEAVPAPSLPFGVNVFGYLDTESGVGEMARLYTESLRSAGVPVAALNIGQKWLRREDRRLRDFGSSNPYSVNLFAVNADQVPYVLPELGLHLLEGRYNIGHWAWELPAFPEKFSAAFRFFDEIWTNSTFVQQSIAQSAPIPVVNLCPGFDLHPPRRRDRISFGLEPDDFIVLFGFDSASNIRRKNPVGLLRAFQKAFPTSGRERLVLKTMNMGERTERALRRLAAGCRLTFLNDYLSREDVLDLIDSCDVYASLHRSEGFGITMLEAMAFGKPVVATDFSGNRDFLNGNTGFPVPCRPVALRRDYGPYEKGNVWADPDIDAAARLLRFVRENSADAARIACRARQAVSTQWSVGAAGERMRNRLEHIRQRRESEPRAQPRPNSRANS